MAEQEDGLARLVQQRVQRLCKGAAGRVGRHQAAALIAGARRVDQREGAVVGGSAQRLQKVEGKRAVDEPRALPLSYLSRRLAWRVKERTSRM